MKNFGFFRLLLLIGSAAGLVAQDTRLSNVSVRTSAGGADLLITGFTIGPGPSKQVLVRAVGPTLGAFGVPGTLADPKLELFNASSVKIAENDNFNSADSPIFASVGAFPLAAGAKDAALVATLAPGSYTAQVSGIGGAAGVALVEVYEVTGGATRLINLSTRAQVGTGGNILIPGITVAPGTGSRRLLLRAVGPTLGAFGVPGTIVDPKLELYSGANKIAENDNWGTPVGSSAADAATLSAAFAANGAFALGAGSKDAALLINLAAGSYTLQVSGVGNTTGVALVEVYDLTPANQTGAKPAASLYVARLRPDPSASGSLASGYATIAVNADGSATVSVAFSNLTSAQTSAHLQLGASRDYVLNLPLGQVSDRTWTFAPSGAFTTNDLINALNSGNIFVGLDSAKNPGAELRGNFVSATGSQAFTAPAAPPTLPAATFASPTPAEAARFLTQATFGPTLAEIDALTKQGIPGWLDQQMALPASSHFVATRADEVAFPNPPTPATRPYFKIAWWNRRGAFWKNVLSGPDQLRQRVAWSLSQILVVGNSAEVQSQSEAATTYHDILVNGAFGNFRQLLEDVTLNPIMGLWLSHLINQKADPVKGTAPDENYAREVQQLFTIGLVQLHPDGSLILDAQGQPIPTYTQEMVADTAKILTGWAFANRNSTSFTAWPTNNYANGEPDDSGWLNPMRYNDVFHDKTAKRIVSLQQVAPASATPTTIAAGQSGPAELKVLLDTLFNHPNTGPFVGRQLIQRLVTSNPSPGYVYRVAQVFANDGKGVRGNLGAVVRAILTDYEARSSDVLGNAGYGKIKEPILRFSALLRSTNARAPNGRFLDTYVNDPRGNYVPTSPLTWTVAALAQGPFDSETVFNFYAPDFSPPGPIAGAGLVAPELQIIDASFAISAPGMFVRDYLFRDVASLPAPVTGLSPFLVLDYSPYLPNARNSSALIDQMNLIWCGGQMSAATRIEIATALQSFPATTADLELVRTAIAIAMICPDGAVQR
jgi:uncharacterized protein (DUF1800 family)